MMIGVKKDSVIYIVEVVEVYCYCYMVEVVVGVGEGVVSCCSSSN